MHKNVTNVLHKENLYSYGTQSSKIMGKGGFSVTLGRITDDNFNLHELYLQLHLIFQVTSVCVSWLQGSSVSWVQGASFGKQRLHLGCLHCGLYLIFIRPIYWCVLNFHLKNRHFTEKCINADFCSRVGYLKMRNLPRLPAYFSGYRLISTHKCLIF